MAQSDDLLPSGLARGQAQFADFHAAEYKRFGDIIKKNNIRTD